MSYDIIGDIHGHADALEVLLTDLGYRNMGGAWRHLARQALFVGDFIDRGPKQMETVSLEELVMWFLTLPVCLDLPDLRVIHACWHVAALEYLRAFLTVDHCLKQETMILATREPENEAEKDTPEMTVFKAVEAVLKGVEVPLPAPHTIRDKDGHDRNRVRVRWWDNGATDYRCAAMLADHERAAFPDDPVPPHALIGHDGGKPVFIGHYWLTGAPELLSNKVACVDYSVAKGGKLVAYRWDGEPTLDERKLHWVRP